MDREDIPDDVKRFIFISIHSVPYLEAMLLLRNESKTEWESKQVARRLYMSERAANDLLTDLHAAGILIATGQETLSYRYHPVSDDLGQMIDRLAEAYSSNLVAVSNLIHSKTSKKAQHFADAFKWRQDS
jgi:light-regulated signal transduction histidine kinase (bacteriophytochrome)